MARAYNTVIPSSEKVLTGGVDACTERPKRFFGAAKNIEEGGSLSIIAALIDAGSKMTRWSTRNSKAPATWNSLDRKIAEKRVYRSYPSLRHRREELLTGDGELRRMWILRKLLHGMEDLPAIEFQLDKLKNTKSMKVLQNETEIICHASFVDLRDFIAELEQRGDLVELQRKLTSY